MHFLSLLLSLLLSTSVAASQFNGLDLISNSEQSIDLSRSKKKVIYFLSSKCPCSQAHFTHLNKLKAQFKDFDFIAFHSHKTVTKEVAQNYFKQFDIEFPVFLDKDLTYANRYEALKTPHVFVLDEKNKVIYQGGATNSRNPQKASKFYLQEVLTALSIGKPSPFNVQKTLGCYIQR